ncbi:MAG: hypothetical protein ABIJ12_12870 [bacterium]
MYITTITFFVLAILLSGFGCSDPKKAIIPPEPEITEINVAWSPDGSTIAATWSGPHTRHKRGIYLINTDNWEITPFLIEEGMGGYYYSPSWSSDGKWLAFARNAQIYKIKLNGDSLTQLTSTSRNWSCDWSDSDSLIMYHITLGDSSGIWIMNSDGLNKKQLVRYGGHSSFIHGDSLLFIEYIRGAADTAHINIINPIDSSTREVYRWVQGHPYHYYTEPRLSPDGQTIVLSIETDIWTMSIDGDDLQQLTYKNDLYPGWSPDNTRIVFTRATVEGGDIYIINRDGTGLFKVSAF